MKEISPRLVLECEDSYVLLYFVFVYQQEDDKVSVRTYFASMLKKDVEKKYQLGDIVEAILCYYAMYVDEDVEVQIVDESFKNCKILAILP